LPLVDEIVSALEGRGDRRAAAKRLAAFSGRSVIDPTSGNLFTKAQTPALLLVPGAPELALDYLERSAGEPESVTDLPEWPMMLPALDAIRCKPALQGELEPERFQGWRAGYGCGLLHRQSDRAQMHGGFGSRSHFRVSAAEPRAAGCQCHSNADIRATYGTQSPVGASIACLRLQQAQESRDQVVIRGVGGGTFELPLTP
jgi:hypothetical protein